MLCGDNSGQSPAVAALTYREDFGETAPAGCLRADPVHLRADTRGLILFDAAAFPLDADESQTLVESLAAHLAQDHWRLVSKHPRRWYLLGERPPQLETPPLPTLRTTPVSATPFSGEDAAAWIRRLNELQMLMHTHPVNLARAARGQPAVNSVWLWGAGEWRRGANPHTRIAADNLFARGVAGACGIPALRLPDCVASLPAAPHSHDSLLVVHEACRDAAAYEDFEAWRDAVEQLERNWFAPLLGALQQRRVDCIDLYALNGSRYRLTRTRLLAVWKRGVDYRRQRGFRQPGARRV